MIRLGYLDEDKGNRNTFYRIFKKDFEVVMLDDFAKVRTLDLLLEEMDKQEIQVLAVDYKLSEKGDVQYDGNQVLEVINERKSKLDEYDPGKALDELLTARVIVRNAGYYKDGNS